MTIEVIETFLQTWKQKALIYYLDLQKEYQEQQKKRYDITEDNLKLITDYAGYKQRYKDELIQEYLKLTPNDYRTNNLKAEINYEYLKLWQKRHTKIDLDIISRSQKDIEKILDRELETKRKNLITRIEQKAGNIINASALYIAGNGEINGFIEGTIKTVQVETITAGGYNVQCFHYRVLVK